MIYQVHYHNIKKWSKMPDFEQEFESVSHLQIGNFLFGEPGETTVKVIRQIGVGGPIAGNEIVHVFYEEVEKKKLGL